MQASSSRLIPQSARGLSNRSLTPVPARSYQTIPARSSISLRKPQTIRQTDRPSRPSTSRTFFSLPDISKLAGLSSSSTDDPSGIETDGDQQRYHARKILPYTQSQLYSLIADVPSYSSFIPFCTSSAVLSAITPSSQRVLATGWKPDDKPFDVEAEMCVGFGGLDERFISRVAGRPFESVTATASDQIPIFKSLVTTWAFAPASPLSPHASNPSSSLSSTPHPTAAFDADPDIGPTLLTIDLAFAFISPLHRIASQAVLPKVAERMVQAFEKRCLEVFGKGRE